MVAVRSSSGLVHNLDRLAAALESLDLRTADLRGAATPQTRDRAVHSIRRYLLPRLTDPDTPISVAFAGPTGSGKSTLVNSVAGYEISDTGPIRPTTTAPVVLASRANANRFGFVGGIGCEVALGTAPILDVVALIDTPDIDSTSLEHRVMAETLIDHADVVVFVTSTLRYADLVPWQVLRRAISRGAPVINVLNRYTSESAGAYVGFRSLLESEGLTGDIVRVPEHRIEVESHRVPSLAVRGLGRRLVAIARDRDDYQQGVLDRVLSTTITQVGALLASADLDRNWLDARRSSIQHAYGRLDDLDLSDAGDLADIGFPSGGSTRQKRKWLRRLGAIPAPTDRIVACVDSDIRRRGHTDEALTEMLHRTVTGWLQYAGRVAGDEGDRDIEVRQTVLIHGAIGYRDPELETFVLGDVADELIARVRRELFARLEVIYSHVRDRQIDRLAIVAGDPGTVDLKRRLSAVVAQSHFADA